MVKLRLSVMMFAQSFAWGVWLVPLSTYMSQGLHFDTLIGTTFGLIGIATIVSTLRSEEHPFELQSLTRISYAVFLLKKNTHNKKPPQNTNTHYINYTILSLM